MVEPNNPVMRKMLDRLFASMVNGPAMNCRPHASRQRIDLAQMARFRDREPGEILLGILGSDGEAKVAARVPAPTRPLVVQAVIDGEDEGNSELTPEDRAARKAWSEQQSLVNKLRVIADDARTYEQDTGVHALEIGFPLLSLPPGSFGGKGGLAGRRVLAPIAFIPITMTVKTGARQTVEIACRGEGVDRVRPNMALLAWLEQQAGQPLNDLFSDESGDACWKEVVELVRVVAKQVEVDVPEIFNADAPSSIGLSSTPRTDDDETTGKAIVCAAVVGLFPTSSQGLLRDVREMVANGAPDGPIEAFVRLGSQLDAVTPADGANAASATDSIPMELGTFRRQFSYERLISHADPCQTRAVRLSRECRGLVVHGPPGTGKSQTIANVISDHLARGERVLFVCDKRTALDVVADRLDSLGLGNLLATVHDPQRDQREFYRSVREQLDNLVDAPLVPDAGDKLKRADAELQVLHDELSEYYRDLMGASGGVGSFHHLAGQWLSEHGDVGSAIDEQALRQIPAPDFDHHAPRLKEALERGEAVAFSKNPWVTSVGIDLESFLATPMNVFKSSIDRCLTAARAADQDIDPYILPFSPSEKLVEQAQRRQALAKELEALPTFAEESIQKWVSKPVAELNVALQQLQRSDALIGTIGASKVDPELLERSAKLTRAHLAEHNAKALTEYSNAFREKAAKYSAAHDASGAASDEIILRWLTSPEPKAVAARKRLDGAAGLADAIEAGALDASLLARFTATPIDMQKVVEWLSALNAYVDIAGKWTSAFQFRVKKEAEPAVKHFGLSLNPSSAAQVKQFLSDLQKREDLRAAIEAAIGEKFADRPDDGELLTAFRQHHGILKSLALKIPPKDDSETIAPSIADSTTAVLNNLVQPQLNPVAGLLADFDLQPNSKSATRLSSFLASLQPRLHLVDLLDEHALAVPIGWPIPADQELIESLNVHLQLLELLSRYRPDPAMGTAVAKFLTAPGERSRIVAALNGSMERARLLLEFESSMASAGLFAKSFQKKLSETGRSNRQVSDGISGLASTLDTLEGVLRVGDGLKRLPSSLSGPVESLLSHQCKASDGFSVIRRNVLAGEMAKRLKESPHLQTVDGHRLQSSFDRYRSLSERKKELVRDDIVHRWTGRQKERLLAGTGTRLNALGADLRRRLTLRGEKAMRLRQVIAHGRGVDGGDPLFDLRPVWMASPETVAQLFAREPIFDVIIFDEASQCRLEEALPVLTRGKRIVIAGDPKQLPPTRFFESTVAKSEDVDAESEQDLFEHHQGEVEDLLTAALSLDGIEQCYLNVHYRSRNSDLIGFSNEHFYGSRLQAIPGHPKSRIRYAPITLYRADGVYEKRKNPAEAEMVCKIVHDLLRRAKPPSIGIACFNMVQRDLIVETLENWAERDPEFAVKLSEARERRGQGSSEGLFVKNLENVQGDERDHLIISTTYGPNAAGKFRRSFGPLGTAGGGRRLNVLVTRAREELHIVTSIPQAAYSTLPPVPQGQIPGGAWLLFAYLAFAAQLKDEYEMVQRVLASSGPAERGTVHVRPSRVQSHFAKSLGWKLAKAKNASSEVHWGNDGFCVDLAMLHPSKAEDVTIGIQCDMSRFAGSEDPVEWDVFQNMVHESQGWKLHRVWTPHFFRDPDGVIESLNKAMQVGMAEDDRA